MRDVDAQVAALETLSPAQLRERWEALGAGPLPRVSPALLRLALGHALQAKTHGGLSRRASQRLDQLGAGKSATRASQPGMRLVREWNGTAHIVTIGEDSVIRWNAREWRSLSEVAREITGTRWSGPAFFGLKRKAAA